MCLRPLLCLSMGRALRMGGSSWPGHGANVNVGPSLGDIVSKMGRGIFGPD